MSPVRRMRQGAVALALATVAFAVPGKSNAGGTCCALVTERFPSSPANEVIQEFNFLGKMHTAWKVQYAWASGKGLYITGAWFRKAPATPWIQVIKDLRLADIFVPYHPGSPRYYDLSQFNFPLIDTTPEDTGCCGEILDRKVVKEVRHTGITWEDDQRLFRGSELVLWAALDAANYNYVIEYAFRDDGVIEFGLGATARNLPGIEMTAHMHTGLWRVDLDINGAANDRVELVRHVESTSGASATDSVTLFNGGFEGSAVWNADEFTTLRISDTRLKNNRNHTTAWDLMPSRMGNARHQEPFSWQDFWVTPYRASELDYTRLPTYIGNNESIDDTDIVVWTDTPVHHLPRDEDGVTVNGAWRGSALIMWGRSMLKPRNLFDRTPFFPY